MQVNEKLSICHDWIVPLSSFFVIGIEIVLIIDYDINIQHNMILRDRSIIRDFKTEVPNCEINNKTTG